MAVLVVAGAADFVLAPRLSIALSVLLSALVLPWAAIVLRRERLVWHLTNLLLVLSFATAKWLVLLYMREEGAALYVGSYRSYTVALVLLLLLGLFFRTSAVARIIASSAEHPARLMAGSFGLAAVLGALLLSLPVSMHDVSEVSLIDSLFMSVSAVCVTGLTTVNVADTYTLTGQVLLCALMQVGGLGIMVLTAAVTMLAGRRLGVKSSAVLAEMVDATSLAHLRRTIAIIVAYTFVFEALGAGALYLQLERLPESSFGYYADGGMGGADSATWAAIFHSISAFCNGSMSNFREGLVPFVHTPLFCQTIVVLIVLGGTGFPVIHELLFRFIDRIRGKRPLRMTLNTRVGLATGAALFFVLAVATFALESGASFSELGFFDRVNAALFHSACSRTSGFNLVDVAKMRPATLLFTCFAMFVGAGPGSTAGGIKTTTLAALFAAFRGELRGEKPRLFDRTLGEAVVRRAIGVAFLSTLLVIAVVFLLLLTERHEPLALLFETVSAFSTTGMSTGITPKLSVAGKLLIIVTMLIGRVGPLTVALALSAQARRPAHELPEERVMIG
jgi:trk system potassium uptake protein TrkH